MHVASLISCARLQAQVTTTQAAPFAAKGILGHVTRARGDGTAVTRFILTLTY
jgi:hypothetical protein